MGSRDTRPTLLLRFPEGLPDKQDAIAVNLTTKRHPEPGSGARLHLQSHNQILVVEDDPGIAESLRDLFTRERFEVAVATTAADGTAHTLRVNPDLMVLDLRLPDATGFDVCRDLCA